MQNQVFRAGQPGWNREIRRSKQLLQLVLKWANDFVTLVVASSTTIWPPSRKCCRQAL